MPGSTSTATGARPARRPSTSTRACAGLLFTSSGAGGVGACVVRALNAMSPVVEPAGAERVDDCQHEDRGGDEDRPIRRQVERERIVALENGDVIQDDNGDPNAGDQMQVFFRPNVEAWVYVVAVDATGWVQPMFPSAFPDAQNPLPAGSTTLIPGEGAWFGLDQYKGTEHIY